MERFIKDLYPKIKEDPRFKNLSQEIYHFLGFNVRVRSNYTAVFGRIKDHYEAFRVTSPTIYEGKHICFYILKVEEEGKPYYYLIDPGHQSFVIRTTRNVAPFLNVFIMVNHIFRERKDLLILHSAAASRRRSGFIFPGVTMAGKTTLSLALMRSGFSFLSDEFAPIKLDQGMVLPYPRSLEARHSTLQLMESLGWEYPSVIPMAPTNPTARHQEPRYLIKPNSHPSIVKNGVPVSFIILMEKRKKGLKGLIRLSKAEALASLFAHALNAPFFGGEEAARAVRQITRMVKKAGCYRLTRGYLLDNVKSLKSLDREQYIATKSELVDLDEVTNKILSKLISNKYDLLNEI